MIIKMEKDLKIVAFDEIIDFLAKQAHSPRARKMIYELRPYLSEAELRKNLKDTTQAREMLDAVGMPPTPAMEHMEELLEKAARYELLLPEELEEIGMFLAAVKRMRDYLERGKNYRISLAYYDENLILLEGLKQELERCIRYGRVDDYASPTLQDIRRKLQTLEDKIKEKAENILRTHKKYMSESFIVHRNGRICLPVKKDYKSKVDGTVADKSSSGTTFFIEPSAVAKLREEKEVLEIEEDNEERRIIYTLMTEITEQEDALRQNLDTLVKLDFIFAKGKLSADMYGKEPEINTDRYLYLKEARHPLLDKESCIPLDFEIGGERRGVIITGPNTGGKTVAIKTVGLFSLMACSGLHLPCKEANICMSNQVLCDIGDGQNIADNLSTFSSHIKNTLRILRQITEESLVIMDELGSGTDPAEGMGIAIAILEQLRMSGCLFLITTHYPEVKTYAEGFKEIINARMAFDRENLKPLYRMEIGKSGDSCALYIAKRLGMPGEMLLMAAKEAYGEKREMLPEELKLTEVEERIKKEYAPSLKKINKSIHSNLPVQRFTRGDSVTLLPDGITGIVVKPENEKGEVIVQIKGEKITVNHKRLKLQVAAAELYPEDYDFSIIFDTVENRKARHKMEKGYQGDLTIYLEE
ncbi:DNA mismatch repair protein MutS [Kineothrix sp. MB12-C1]|nr:DNA mismatch repair protein MutS [Kineothrix sp. MB12-C1]WMC91118.1 DNA mismatch repair protein MutS [Kineothrix sp. MB12-C1]